MAVGCVDDAGGVFVADEEGRGDVFAGDDGGECEAEVSAAHDGYADWIGWWIGVGVGVGVGIEADVVVIVVDHLE